MLFDAWSNYHYLLNVSISNSSTPCLQQSMAYEIHNLSISQTIGKMDWMCIYYDGIKYECANMTLENLFLAIIIIHILYFIFYMVFFSFFGAKDTWHLIGVKKCSQALIEFQMKLMYRFILFRFFALFNVPTTALCGLDICSVGKMNSKKRRITNENNVMTFFVHLQTIFIRYFIYGVQHSETLSNAIYYTYIKML